MKKFLPILLIFFSSCTLYVYEGQKLTKAEKIKYKRYCDSINALAKKDTNFLDKLNFKH
jgi:hypothetical protein